MGNGQTPHERLVGLTTALARAFTTWSDEAAPPLDRWRFPVQIGERRLVIVIEEHVDGREADADAGEGDAAE